MNNTTPAQSAETQAINNLNNDLYNEPYNLIDYLILNNKPFTDIVAGNYSVGREELQIYYGTPAITCHFILTDSRPAHCSPAGTGSCSRSPRPPGGPRDRLEHAAHFAPDDDRGSVWQRERPRGGIGYGFGATYQKLYLTGEISPIAQSGISPRPLSGTGGSPINGDMRTFASRYFIRLLCGEPNMYPVTTSART